MAELLDALQAEGIQTAVFSNKADEFCGKIVEHYFGKGKFTVIRGSRKGVPTKPDPAGVYALMQDIGADPKTTLFIGDSDVDILTGHNAHLPPWACSGASGTKPSSPPQEPTRWLQNGGYPGLSPQGNR